MHLTTVPGTCSSWLSNRNAQRQAAVLQSAVQDPHEPHVRLSTARQDQLPGRGPSPGCGGDLDELYARGTLVGIADVPGFCRTTKKPFLVHIHYDLGRPIASGSILGGTSQLESRAATRPEGHNHAISSPSWNAALPRLACATCSLDSRISPTPSLPHTSSRDRQACVTRTHEHSHKAELYFSSRLSQSIDRRSEQTSPGHSPASWATHQPAPPGQYTPASSHLSVDFNSPSWL